MKQTFKYLLLSFLFIGLIQGCEKDEATPAADAQRGKVINYYKVVSYTPEAIAGLTYLLDPALLDQVNIKHGIDIYSVFYETVSPNGLTIQATGMLVIPVGAGLAPIATFQHGTILNKIDVPSNSGQTKEVGYIFGTEGYVAVLPDFIGLGQGDGFHPYMHAESEAIAVVDMLRATKTICSELGVGLNGELFVSGYSHGGHVAMAATKALQEDYSDEFNVTASAPMAGPYDVSGTMYDLLMAQEAYVVPAFLPYMLYSYNMVYGIWDDVNSVFIEPYNTSLKGYFHENTMYDLSEVDAILPESKIPSAIIKADILAAIKADANHPLRVALADNDLYDWTPNMPMHIYHSDADLHVPFANSQKAYDTFVANGAQNIELINPLVGGDHTTAIIPSIFAAKDWFNSLRTN